jgi:hypothetical protein
MDSMVNGKAFDICQEAIGSIVTYAWLLPIVKIPRLFDVAGGLGQFFSCPFSKAFLKLGEC